MGRKSAFKKNYHHRRYCFKNRFVSFFFYLIDLFGCFFFNQQRNRRNLNPVSIGLLVFDHLGDALLITPLLRFLRKKYPQAVIHVFCADYNLPVFLNNPNLDKLIPLEAPWLGKSKKELFNIGNIKNLASALRESKVEMAIDTRSDFRHIVAMFLAGVRFRIGFGFGGFGFLLTHQARFRYNPDYLRNYQVENKWKLIQSFLDDTPDVELKPGFHFEKCFIPSPQVGNFSAGSYVLFHIGGGGAAGKMNRFPEHLFHPALEFLAAVTDVKVAVTGFTGETGYADISGNEGKIFDFRDKISFQELAFLIKKAGMVLSSSTVALHLAACFEVPAVTVFSLRDSPVLWNPPGSRSILFHYVDCALCEKDYCDEEYCIRRIGEDALIEEIRKRIEVD